MKIIINRPVEIEIKIGMKLKSYDFEDKAWYDTEVIKVDNQEITFKSSEGLEWTDNSLCDLSDPKCYKWPKF